MRRALVLDTGAFIAAERWERKLLAMIDGAADAEIDVLVPATVVAEAWRQPSRANAAMLLDASTVVAIERVRAQRVGVLLGLAGSAQVVDGCVADVAIRRRPSVVLTADPEDIHALIRIAGHSSATVTPSGEPSRKPVDVLVQAL